MAFLEAGCLLFVSLAKTGTGCLDYLFGDLVGEVERRLSRICPKVMRFVYSWIYGFRNHLSVAMHIVILNAERRQGKERVQGRPERVDALNLRNRMAQDRRRCESRLS
ncbi:hypothetical protein PCH_Pc21g20330 [Penicillium rubens Wisconsin 54-1255]|uniref:Secreted protein n=1 Tax=Penicillium rubens (strain ATCC 28089 / DSM 1075 / NRRL 1951 / Wisconsin 54-1255) TaxID=500485 RepID=B6HKM8_PENRW|nr:hypothetical protein PCH_Pc21g20330 [Penicillium rubens Wisconsin 54-1255]